MGTETAVQGRALLADRISHAPGLVAGVPRLLEPLLETPTRLPRMLVTTGIGTSEGHARHFAELAAHWAGWPARFATTGSLARGAPPGSEQDWLVVFYQGLRANARFALQDVEHWGGVVLVSGLPWPGSPDFTALTADKRDWLESLAARGVIRIDMGCGPEYGALIRVVGARVGYAIAWSLLRTLAARRLESLPRLEIGTDDLRRAQLDASRAVESAFPAKTPLAPFFDPMRPLLLVAHEGYLELASQLALALAEGMLRPRPSCVDVLHFAHGPLQGIAERRASIVYLAAPGEGSDDWHGHLALTLDSERHDLRMLRASLPPPFSVVEHAAMLDELILRMLDEEGLDLVAWPGADREAALYDLAPELASGAGEASPTKESAAETRIALLAEAAWPEVEAWLAQGRRTALVGLGSIEQHGPHLPLATDQWIADALLCRLAARLEEAVALPAIALGCASEHLDFPGTLHLEPATLEVLLGDLLDSLQRHGFERAFLFTAHGGNVAALEEMGPRLVRRVRPLELAIETDLTSLERLQRAVVEAGGLAAEVAGPHAGEFETSVVAGLRPGAVRRAALSPGLIPVEGEAQSLFYPSLRRHAERGVVGDPSASAAERGPAYLDAWSALLEDAYHAAFDGRTQKKRV
jgi:creatinine amidohydrolase